MVPKVWEFMSNLFLLGPSGLTIGKIPLLQKHGRGSPQARLVGGVLDTNLIQVLEQLSARDRDQPGLSKAQGT